MQSSPVFILTLYCIFMFISFHLMYLHRVLIGCVVCFMFHLTSTLIVFHDPLMIVQINININMFSDASQSLGWKGFRPGLL